MSCDFSFDKNIIFKMMFYEGFAQPSRMKFIRAFLEESEKLRQAGAKYAAQQAAESNSAKKRRGPNGDEYPMPTKLIKFGTNVDLSDDVRWKAQLQVENPLKIIRDKADLRVRVLEFGYRF